MIIEYEILEQISEDIEWKLSKVINFLSYTKDAWKIIENLFKDKCIDFVDGTENILPKWKTNEVLRNKELSNLKGIKIRITKVGLKRVYGNGR